MRNIMLGKHATDYERVILKKQNKNKEKFGMEILLFMNLFHG